MIKIKNKKVHDFIIQKDELVDVGRGITAEIEKIEKEIGVFEEKEKKITGDTAPDPKLKEEGDALVLEFNKILERLEAIGKEIEKKKLAAIPQDLLDKHKIKLKEKERLERERNKIALKIQKIKDKIIPVIQKEVKPLLEEYDDIETAKAENGEVVITTFNHFEDWKKKFHKRQ